MEISCRENGEIVLRKIDMTLTLEEFSAPAAKLLAAQMNATVLVSNLDGFICGSGGDKASFVGSSLPPELKQSLAGRKSYSSGIPEKWGFKSGALTIAAEPITGESDIFGGIFAVSGEPIGANDLTLLKITAAVLGSSLQKY